MDEKAKFYWNPYLVWQKAQGIPIHTGFFVEDARQLPVGFWRSRNANGAFINLAASQFNDAYVLEIPPTERTTPRRQLFDEITIVIEGQIDAGDNDKFHKLVPDAASSRATLSRGALFASNLVSASSRSAGEVNSPYLPR